MSACEIATVSTVSNSVSTGVAMNVGLLSGIGVVIAVGAVGVWVYTKQNESEIYDYNLNKLKEEFAFMLGEVKKLQEAIFEKFNVKVDFLEKLGKEAEFGIAMYNKELIKDPAHNVKYEKIMQDFANEAKKSIYKLKELESETLEEMNKKIECISNEFETTQKDETLNEQAQKMDAIKHKLQGEFASWEDKYSLVSQYQATLDGYKKELKAIAMQKGIERLIEGVEEEEVTILTPSQKLIAAINEFKEKIKKYDSAYNRFADIATQSKDKLQMVLDSIKLDYGKAKEVAIWSAIYKEDLAKLSKLELDSSVQSKITTLKNQEKITKEEFKSIADEINDIIIKKQERAMVIEQLKENLNGMGYSVVNENESLAKLENGEIVYVDTEEEDYKIMLKLNPQTMDITTRIVRVVATKEEKENISSYQKEKDLEASKKWCSSYDKLTHLLKINGIELNTTLRIEPEYDDMTYIVDSSLASKGKQQTTQERGDNVRYMDE